MVRNYRRRIPRLNDSLEFRDQGLREFYIIFEIIKWELGLRLGKTNEDFTGGLG